MIEKNKILEQLKKSIFEFSKTKGIQLEISENETLENGALADIVVRLNNRVVALGQLLASKIQKQKNDPHFYFHAHPFLQGGYGNCWFYFDGQNFVFHEIWFDYPVDNYTQSFNDILDRSLQQLEK